VNRNEHAELMKFVVLYLQQRGGRASTTELLTACRSEFGGARARSAGVQDMAVLKAVVKRVARLRKSESGGTGSGLWVLLPEHAL